MLTMLPTAYQLPSDEKRPALAFVTMFAELNVWGHIVGSTLPLAATAIREHNDLDIVSHKIVATKSFANQVLAVMISVSLTCLANTISPVNLRFQVC